MADLRKEEKISYEKFLFGIKLKEVHHMSLKELQITLLSENPDYRKLAKLRLEELGEKNV